MSHEENPQPREIARELVVFWGVMVPATLLFLLLAGLWQACRYLRSIPVLVNRRSGGACR